MAVIGRNAAVVDLGFIKFSGILAWLTWVFVHIYFLIEFDNKLVVMLQWGWSYWTRNRGARLITGESLLTVDGEQQISDRFASVNNKTAVEI